MFDFPAGPVMGDEYTSADGVKYVWDGFMWAVPPDAATSNKIYGIGLLESIDKSRVDLKLAGLNGEIGGVMTVGRSPLQGLDLDVQTGILTAPLATHVAAGTIVEPPNDGAPYARSFDNMSGGGKWVPASGAGVHIADAPPTAAQPNDLWWDSDSGNLFVLDEDADSTQWVQINVVAPPFAGVEEAPTDGQAYLRQSSAWTAGLPLTGGTLTGALIAEGPIDSHNGQTIAVRGPWNPVAGAGAGQFVIGNEDGRAWASMQARYISAAGNGEFEIAFGALCGGWGWKEAFKTTLASPSGINVSGDCSAASVTDRTLLADPALANDSALCGAIEWPEGDERRGVNIGKLLGHALARIRTLEARLAAKGI
jgi:hypothetical protein